MNNKIQELTDIIYNEGVVKGQAEAEKVLADAKAQAEQILAEAKAQADSIVEAAKKSAAEMSENTTKELKLYASQALNALKSEVASVVTDTIVKEEVSGFVSQKDYLNQFIVQLASKWAENEQIVISVADAEELKKYFMSKAKELLDKISFTFTFNKVLNFLIKLTISSFWVLKISSSERLEYLPST